MNHAKLEEAMRTLGKSVPPSTSRKDRETWLLSRGWRVRRPGRVLPVGDGKFGRTEEDWIDPTGLDHNFEQAVGWQLWADASELIQDLGWGYRAAGRSNERRANSVTVPKEVTGRSSVACSLIRALGFYSDNRQRADFYAKLFKEGHPRSEWPAYDECAAF